MVIASVAFRFGRVLLRVRVMCWGTLDILRSERLGGVNAADDYVFAVRKTVMSRNAWFGWVECGGSKEAWLEDSLYVIFVIVYFFSAEVRSHRVQARAARVPRPRGESNITSTNIRQDSSGGHIPV
jgi:hypothetical protein